LWSITLIGRLTVVKLNFPVIICFPTYFIRSLPAFLYFDMTALSVRPNPPSLYASGILYSSDLCIILNNYGNK
jgi:hypothetical protein